jgi:hypothetical protein
MGIAEPNQPYNPVKTQVAQGGGGEMQRETATEASFGAGVGQAMEQAGNKFEKYIDHEVGLINEAKANNSEANILAKAGELKNEFSQYKGLQAVEMQPVYNEKLNALWEEERKGLSPESQRMFDANTMRTRISSVNEYGSYARKQAADANISSHDAIANAAVNSVGDLDNVLENRKFSELKNTVVYSAQQIASLNGMTTSVVGRDAKGDFVFSDDEKGIQEKAVYNELKDKYLNKMYENAAKNISAAKGSVAAFDWVKNNPDIPDVAKLQLNQFFAPKIKNEDISNVSNNVLNKANSQYETMRIVDAGLNTPLDVIRKNEGSSGYSKDNKGEVINGINSLAYPKEFAEAKAIYDQQGQEAALKYTDNFYTKNIIDKYGISSLPAENQAIVADGLVNHGAGQFGQSLLNAAKNGATPEQLIDMRQDEYERLNATGKPEYTKNYKGWLNRLEGLRQQADATNLPTQPMSKADFLKENYDQYVETARKDFLEKYPDDIYGADRVEKRMRMNLDSRIKVENFKLQADRDIITNAIEGQMSKGIPPQTYEDLVGTLKQAGQEDVLDRVMTTQGKFYNKIENMLQKTNASNATVNSNNGYDVVMRGLAGEDDKNGIDTVDGFAKYLGRTDVLGITLKDYNDAKETLQLDASLKSALKEQMNLIANANGNIDGNGQKRALSWYQNSISTIKNLRSANDKITPDEIIAKLKETQKPILSQMSQISEIAKAIKEGKIPKVTNEGIASLPPGPFLYDTVDDEGNQITRLFRKK